MSRGHGSHQPPWIPPNSSDQARCGAATFLPDTVQPCCVLYNVIPQVYNAGDFAFDFSIANLATAAGGADAAAAAAAAAADKKVRWGAVPPPPSTSRAACALEQWGANKPDCQERKRGRWKDDVPRRRRRPWAWGGASQRLPTAAKKRWKRAVVRPKALLFAPALSRVQGGGKPAAAKGSAKPGGGVTVGQFTVEPSEGTVEPGGKVEVSVVFKAEGAQVRRVSACG